MVAASPGCGCSVAPTAAPRNCCDADLVVDASGRGSRTPAWLEALGYPPPQQEQVQIGLGYATRTYRLPAAALDGNLAILVAATPQHPRTGAMQRLEDDRWMLTLAGILGDHPPTDPDGFVEFARSLPFPDIWEAIRDAEPLDDPVAFRFPASVRHRYERLRRFPAGLLVMGDALCSFNPIYGQGMSVAALEALTLRRHLASGVEPQPRRWFRDLARVVDVPWQMAAGGDLMFPDVQGRRTRKIRLHGRLPHPAPRRRRPRRPPRRRVPPGRRTGLAAPVPAASRHRLARAPGRPHSAARHGRLPDTESRNRGGADRVGSGDRAP